MTEAAGGAAAGGSNNGGAAASGGTGAAGAAGAAGAGGSGAAGGAAAGGAAGAGAASGAGTGGQGGAGAAGGAAAGAGAAASGAGAGAAAGAAGAAGAGAAADDASKGAGAAWDATWRESYAGTDEKKLNQLKRYDSPRAVLDALFSAQQKISSGELKAPLPKDATPEQLAAYRKDNGIPEKADAYFTNLPDGVKLTDSDKEMLKPYADLMHKHNLSPQAASEFLGIRAKMLDDLIANQSQNDQTLRAQVEESLRAEWGGEYRANINNIRTMLQGAPEDVREAILSARTSDGRALFNHPATTQYFAHLARQLNPFGTIVGADGGALTGKGAEARIAEINGMMGKPDSAYWKGAQSAAIQKEYRDLLTARERATKHAAA